MIAFVKNSNLENVLTKIAEPYIVSDDDVKIKMEYCSLCRDDMHNSDSLNIFGKIGTLGHEGSGVIVELGSHAKCKGFNLGDRVILQVIDACGTCKYCLNQTPQFCPEATLSQGVLSEYVVRKYRQLIKIPDDLSFKQASLVEPVGDVVDALSKICLDFETDVLLIGAGFTGLVFSKLLKHKGVRKVIVIEPIEDRQKLAFHYGADYAFSPSDENLELKLMEITDFFGYDLVIDTSSDPSIIESIHPFITAGGTLLLFAYSDIQAKLRLNAFNMYKKNITLIWSCLSSVPNMKMAASLIKKFSFEKLITAEYPFSQCLQAYKSYLGKSEIKIGIRMRNF